MGGGVVRGGGSERCRDVIVAPRLTFLSRLLGFELRSSCWVSPAYALLGQAPRGSLVRYSCLIVALCLFSFLCTNP